jgi:hypothetical protein
VCVCVCVCFANMHSTSANEKMVQIEGAELLQSGPTRRVVAKNVITCAGLHADTVSRLAEGDANPKVDSSFPCFPSACHSQPPQAQRDRSLRTRGIAACTTGPCIFTLTPSSFTGCHLSRYILPDEARVQVNLQDEHLPNTVWWRHSGRRALLADVQHSSW